MTRGALALLVAGAVTGAGAGCSGEPAAPPAPTPSASAAAAPPVARTGAVRNGSAGMTGSVSALAGDTSGLSTRVTDAGTIVDLPADALFAFDSAELTPVAAASLAKTADLIRAAPAGAGITVTGHTDAKGEDDYNLALSERRARAVADWFGAQVGVRQRSFTVEGRGEAEPVAPNEGANGVDDPAGRARNRRVEVLIPR